MTELPAIPFAADEATTLHAFLDYQRAVLDRKTDGLDAGSLSSRIPPSSMTLGGLLAHLAFVEDYWFGCVLHARRPSEPWEGIDWKADPDADWRHGEDRSPDELRALWQTAVESSRTACRELPLEQPAERERHGSRPSLRWILVHMIEEYARHLGHADLLRESIDGSTGD